MDINDSTIGNKLREIRISHRLTIEQMAELLGVSISHWGYVDRGQRLPSLDVLILVCQKFNISLDSLLSVEKEEPTFTKTLPKEWEVLKTDELLTITNIFKLLATNTKNKNGIVDSRIMGERIKEVRNQRGLSLRQAAKEIGITWSYLEKLEQGNNIPSLKVLKKITEVLKVTPDYLFAHDLPTAKPILYSEFMHWYHTLTEEQQKLARKMITIYLQEVNSEPTL